MEQERPEPLDITDKPDGAGKYDGVNPLEKLHQGEPYFFIRSTDLFAPSAVEAYAAILDTAATVYVGQGDLGLANNLQHQARDVRAFAARMQAWQSLNPNRVHLPD